MTKFVKVAACCVLALVLAALVWSLVEMDSPSPASLESPYPPTLDDVGGLDSTEPQKDSVVPSAPVPRNAPRADNQDHRSVAVRDQPAGSRSDEDAAWLRSGLYPTQDEIDASRLEGQELSKYVPQTSLETARAERALYRDESRAEAEGQLLSSAELGSIYALVALAQYYDPTSPVLSQAYYRAALMRGDWLVAMRPKPSLDNIQDALASMTALQILEGMDQRRASRGLPPLGRDMRPGLEQFSAELHIVLDEMSRSDP